jgi:hypothetical protein
MTDCLSRNSTRAPIAVSEWRTIGAHRRKKGAPLHLGPKGNIASAQRLTAIGAAPAQSLPLTRFMLYFLHGPFRASVVSKKNWKD